MTPRGENGAFGVVAVIALYNGEAFIGRALDSVRAQTRPPDEVVVVDDGSRDGGAAIVEKFARDWPTLRLVRKANGGQSSARNAGVAASGSGLIAFLDQDDFWYSDHLQALLAPFSAAELTPTGWAYADVDVGTVEARAVDPQFLRKRPGSHPKVSLAECAARDMFVLPSASLIRRSAFEAVGGFDEALSGYEDDDLFFRILAAGFDTVYIDRPLSMWCIHTASATFTPAMARSRMIFARKLLAYCDRPCVIDAQRICADIARRFSTNLVGEYVRAVRRQDLAVALKSLGDIESTFLPHVPPARRQAYRLGLSILRLGLAHRIVAKPRLVALLRRMAGLPKPPVLYP